MSELLLTGASGHLGTALLKKLLAMRSYEVTALVRGEASAERLRRLSAGAARVVASDLSVGIPAAVRGTRFAVVVHCAAHIPKVADEDLSRAELYAANVRGTANLLASLADRARHLVFVSSLAVYSQGPSDRPIAESAPCVPATFYGASKLIGERLARLHCDAVGTKLTVLRTHSLYGPGETQSRALPTFFRLAFEDRPIFLAGMGRARRNYVYVNDAADAVLSCIRTGSEGTANVAGAQVFSLAELAHEVVRACGGRSALYRLPGTGHDLVLDTAHARDAFGIACDTRIARGIEAQYAWLSAQREGARDFYEFL